ncbi:MAG: acyl-CoA dehydrogenase [Pseudomonadota bacterium]
MATIKGDGVVGHNGKVNSMNLFHRVLDFEKYLGDPASLNARISFIRQLEDDENECFPELAVSHLHEWGLHKFYVPETLPGGHLSRIDEFLLLLRAVARRDLTVAIGHGKTFLGAVAVWVGASQNLQSRCAKLVLDKKPVSLGLTEVAHGSDLIGNACRIDSTALGKYTLHGEKWLINNATRSDALTVYANTSGRTGANAGTLVWVEKAKITGDYTCLPKELTHGIRGADISGIRFDGAAVQESDFIGAVGSGLDITLRSLQISRTLCCALSIGASDTALRAAFGFSKSRTLYGDVWINHPLTRKTLVEMFCRQLVAETLSLSAARLLHVIPAEMSLVSSVAKYLVPKTAEGIFKSSRALIGARSLLRETNFSFFQKFDRDNKLVGLFDGSSVVNLQAIVQQLRQLSIYGLEQIENYTNEDVDAELDKTLESVFCMHSALPALDFKALSLSNRGRDSVLQRFGKLLRRLDREMQQDGEVTALEEVITLGKRIQDAYVGLLDEVVVKSLGKDMRSPASFDAAKRYSDLYAAACCYYVWFYNRANSEIEFDPAFRNGQWLVVAFGQLVNSPPQCDSTGVFDWASRLYADQQAFSILPYETPFSPTFYM